MSCLVAQCRFLFADFARNLLQLSEADWALKALTEQVAGKGL